MTSALQLQGRVALVTGGSRGIGLAVADALLSAGAHVMISGMAESHLADARASLETRRAATAAPVQVETMSADVRNEQEVRALVSSTVDRLGGLDILINNAGIGRFSPVADQAPDDWRSVIDTNLTAVFYCCQAAIPHLRRRGGGWIINISSLAARNAFAGGAAYCASKAGLNAFTDVLMQEVRYDDIRVSCIMPGSVSTGFGGHGARDGEEWKLGPQDVAQVVLDLLAHTSRSLPSRVEMRPSKPRK